MNRKVKYAFLGLAFWLLLFLGWEWWRSYPKVRLTPISHPKTKEAKVDSVLVQSLADFLIPGIAVGIVRDQKVTYLKAFGFSDLGAKDSLHLESQMAVASVSKVFTALALANFCLEQGILLDTTLSAILPKGKELPKEFDSLTLRELLEHRSGMSDSRSISNVVLGDEKRQLDLLTDQLKSPDPENSAYQYADVNFDLIGLVMEVIAAQPFETLIQETTLKDAGMNQSFFPKEQSDTLHGHKQTFLWKRFQATKFKLERYPSPSSGLILTPKDLSKALLHLCRGDMGSFSEELDWLSNSGEIPAGFQKIRLNDKDFWGHYGEQDGFSSLLVYAPNQEIGLFLLSNLEDKRDFRKRIAEAVLRTIDPAPRR